MIVKEMILSMLLIVLLMILACSNAFTLSTTLSTSLINKRIYKSSSTILMANGQVPYVPYYPNPASKDYQWMDIYNALGRKRTLFVGRFLDDESSNQLIASLIWLQSQNEKDPITLYMNVPGSIIKPALAVYDTLQRMTCPIITINTGLTVGMGALICAAGTPGMRYALPNARFLMSKTGIEDGYQGQASDIAVTVREVMKDNEKVTKNLARLCGQPTEKLQNDLKRDFYLTATEACAYGVIDKIMAPTQPVKIMKYRGADDEVIGFGHFSEARKVMEGPTDDLKRFKEPEEFDEYAAKEMMNKGVRKSDRIDPKSLRNGGGANRFANSRCRPPAPKKPIIPKGPNGEDLPPSDQNPFKNTGW